MDDLTVFDDALTVCRLYTEPVTKGPALSVSASLPPVAIPIQPSLLAAYGDWLATRQAVLSTKAMFAARSLPVAQASVVLENALMHTLLHDEVARPAALWPRVGSEAIAVGLAAARVGDRGLAESLSRGIAETLREPIRPAALPQPVVTPWHFTIGGFQLRRNDWVNRAWQVVADRDGPAAATTAVLVSALRYAGLLARTRHIGPPRRVYDAFYDWGVRHEGFASPFNARLMGRPGARFFSACGDVDAPFGSAGSFFNVQEQTDDGAWCLDPPFLDATIARVEDRIRRWHRPGAPAILLIIPASYTVANQPDETVLLKRGVHVYEGLAGTEHPLPVDVAIHRYGELPGFNQHSVQAGYLPLPS